MDKNAVKESMESILTAINAIHNTSKECSAEMANALNTYKEQLTLAGVTASALLLNAKDWWATECWHKKYDELTKQQQRIIDKEFTVFKLYRDFLHSQ